MLAAAFIEVPDVDQGIAHFLLRPNLTLDFKRLFETRERSIRLPHGVLNLSHLDQVSCDPALLAQVAIDFQGLLIVT